MAREVYTYTIKFKLEVVNALLNRGSGVTVLDVAERFNLGKSTVQAWQAQYKKGILSLDNAIAVSRKPNTVVNGDTYHVAGKSFRTKAEAIAHAVKLAGGITVTRIVTEQVAI